MDAPLPDLDELHRRLEARDPWAIPPIHWLLFQMTEAEDDVPMWMVGAASRRAGRLLTPYTRV